MAALKATIRRITGTPWNPAHMVVDFERAAINAVRAELPGTQVEACYFHYTQALMRKVNIT